MDKEMWGTLNSEYFMSVQLKLRTGLLDFFIY